MNSEEQATVEHYRMIRKNAEYRNFCMMEELMAEMQPPLAPYNLSPIVLGIEKKPSEIDYNASSGELTQEIETLRRECLYLRNKLFEHLAEKRKPKGKY